MFKDKAKRKAYQKKYYQRRKQQTADLPLTQQLTQEKVATQKGLSKKETYLARLRELEVLEKEGKLVKLDDVRDTVTKKARTVRDSILNIPSRVAPIIVTMTAWEAEQLLNKELKQALDALSMEDL
jgi:phage terminase Nu1 subunit (DNA packaging protein)